MKKLFFTLISLIIANTASAANIWCSGTVSNAYVDNTGNLVIKGSWNNQYIRLCNTNGNAGVDTITCSLWFSTISTALVNDKQVMLQYGDQGGTMTCSNIPTYLSAPTPAYLMLIK